jgi:hypothetical protein
MFRLSVKATPQQVNNIETITWPAMHGPAMAVAIYCFRSSSLAKDHYRVF